MLRDNQEIDEVIRPVVKDLCSFAKIAITKYHKLSDLTKMYCLTVLEAEV